MELVQPNHNEEDLRLGEAPCRVPPRHPSRITCKALPPRLRRLRRIRRQATRQLLKSIARGALVVCAYMVLLVLSSVIVHRTLPELTVGGQHALLTLQALVAAAITGILLLVSSRRRERSLSATAERITELLEACNLDSLTTERFENPHLVHCREALTCNQGECPMYDAANERCWQVRALSRALDDSEDPSVQIRECHECFVYRTSCPDKLTELGEAFNNLMFLLERDARQLARIRGQMVEKEKMVAIGQMASGIAHEVGNPLSSISSTVQMLQRANLGEGASEGLSVIAANILRITTIVRQLARVARPAPEKWERVDLGETLEEVVRLVSFDRRAHSVEIQFAPPSTPLHTYALRNQLQQVFLNLALNALDAMPDGGTLVIKAQRVRSDLVVAVQDDGCGIAPETGRRIFEPFFTTKEPGSGTGLGLAVSYGIIQKHGGRIDFKSVLGIGTTVAVTIPVVSEPPKDHGASPPIHAGGS